jgi:predicted transcriptional regulator
MATAKQGAMSMIQKMPDEITWEELAFRVYTRSRIEAGLADFEAGRVTSHEDLKAEVDEWLASFGRTKQNSTTVESSNGLLATP